LKIGKEIEEEVEALFGPCNHNGYTYCHNEDEGSHFKGRDIVDDHASTNPKCPTLE
jgi:hypothetical protein